MSQNTINVGKINGNPLCGLNERVCAELKIITDGCRSVYDNEPTQVLLTSLPQSYVSPLTFVSLSGNGAATVSNLTVTNTATERSKISYTCVLPVNVYLVDASGNTFTERGEITFYKDVLLSVPQNDTPYSVEVACVARSSVGRFLSQNVLNVSLCAVLVTRITQKRTVVLPIYGDCVYPDCREFLQECGGESRNPSFENFLT